MASALKSFQLVHPNVWCESFLQYFEMHLALPLKDTEKQLLFPLWRTLFEDRTLLSPQSWGPQIQSFLFSLSSVSSYSRVFRYLTLLTALFYPGTRRSSSVLKCNTQRSNQTPAESWPALSEVHSLSSWLCHSTFIVQGCSYSGTGDTVVYWCTVVTRWGWYTDREWLHKRPSHVHQHR